MKYTLAIFTILIVLSIATNMNCDDNNKSSTAKETPAQLNLEKIKPKKVTTTKNVEATNKISIIPSTDPAEKLNSPPSKILTKKQQPQTQTPKRTNTKLATKNKSKSKDIIIEEEVATLVEYPIEASSSISYYYPYFVKSNLITFADEIDIEYLATACSDATCMYCDPINITVCSKCMTGFFLFNGSCNSICPLGYYADTLRYKCVPDSSTVEIVYTKAYSIGSCINACGFERIDCDCSPSCRLNGTCCTDFDLFECPVVVEFFARKSSDEADQCAEKNIGCKFCDKKKLIDTKEQVKKCNQCKEGYFLFEGRCFETCPERTIENPTNKICERKPLCDIENCGVCGNASTCKTCKNGYFKSGNECLKRCPEGYRADRITWTCLEPPVFAWYWVYPSRSSCQNYCGIIVQEDWDCSCSSDCFYYGNCCQDVDYYCDEILFWRKSGNKLSKNNKMKNSANKPNPALPALPSKLPKELTKKTEEKKVANNKMKTSENKPNPALPALPKKLPKELTKKTEEKPAVAKRTNIDNKNLDAGKKVDVKEKEKENVKEKRVMVENKEKKEKTTNEKKEKITTEKKEKKTDEKVVAPKKEKKTDEKVVAPKKEKKTDAKILELRENDVKAKRTDTETEGKEEQKTEFKNENKLTEEDKEFKVAKIVSKSNKEKKTNEKVVEVKKEQIPDKKDLKLRENDEKSEKIIELKENHEKVVELKENDIKAKRTDSTTQEKEEKKTEFKNESQITEGDKDYKPAKIVSKSNEEEKE